MTEVEQEVEAFIHSIGINRLKSERAKKLFLVHCNKRLIRKIKQVEYESEEFKWDVRSEAYYCTRDYTTPTTTGTMGHRPPATNQD